MRRLALVGIGALLLVLAGATPVVAIPAVAAGGSVDAAQQATPEPAAEGPTTEIEVHLRADRSARWVVTTRYPLEDEASAAAFRTYAEAFERGEAEAGVDDDFFRHAANRSGEVAGREMGVRNVTRSAEVDGSTGTLRLGVTWTGFLGRADDGDLVARDAFRLPDGGTWLATLHDDQDLVVHTPPGHEVNTTSAPVQPQGDAVVIEGPRSFEEEPLVITYRRTERTAFPSSVTVGGAVTATVLLVLLAAVLYRQRRDPGSVLDRTRGGAAGSTTDGTAGGEGSAGGGDTGAAGPAGTAGATGAGATGASERAEGDAVSRSRGESAGRNDGDGDGTDEPAVDPELLSDEERVEWLLERNGGRMKQAAIVDETGWSDAKVSQLLSAMADEGRVEKLRLGRENIISLPDEEDGDDAAESGAGGPRP